MTLAVASSCAEMKQEETADLEELTALSSLLTPSPSHFQYQYSVPRSCLRGQQAHTPQGTPNQKHVCI